MNYYDQYSQLFIDSTLNVDMSDLYSMFLENIPKGSYILDIGCGPGRDLNYFRENDYNAKGLEPSSKLAAYARAFSQCEVIEIGIEDYESKEKYDGIWACASLLHLDTENLEQAFIKISGLMHDTSIFYCSFKYGSYEGKRNGRFFNDQTLESVEALLPDNLGISKSWINTDKRVDRDESWLNLLISRSIR